MLTTSLARNAIEVARRQARERLASMPPEQLQKDTHGVMQAVLSMPAEAFVADVVALLRRSAGMAPRSAAVHVLDARIKAMRAAAADRARLAVAEAVARRLDDAARAVAEGHSVQDWTAQEPYVHAAGARLGLVHSGRSIAVATIDGQPVHTYSAAPERAALQGLQDQVAQAYRAAAVAHCAAFRVERVTHVGTDGLAITDRRGRAAVAYVEAGHVRVVEVDGLPVDSDGAPARAIAEQIRL
ncbi:hypothetical protein AVMA1855_23325 [Acidovorax sp. SUPP1855]|uniref:hypothetical protein n=1 Tax=Acidovorax sp. SUPP1855 TaxID=431774 RepID=UPI0023DE248C|nr:hypothetical protein [Acidovorax sp. SUPP1855]GKS87139.1 hypothetical protein AVMA1855_23325 [Acidovorax sp. SUPP1855]